MKLNSSLSFPLQVQFDITNKCNFRCLHCYNESGDNNVCDSELTDADVLSLFDEFKKFTPYNICFCGGEPLLRKNLIFQASRIVKGRVPNLSIVTNGYLLDYDTFNELIESGVNRIQLSIDGNNKETHEYIRQKKYSFENVFNALDICTKAKTGLTDLMVAFTPTKFNISEFPQLVDKLVAKGVTRIRVQPLMIMGRANKNKGLKPERYQYYQLMRYIHNIQTKYGSSIIDWGDPVDHIIRYRTILSGVGNNLTIKANGNIVASPYIPISFGNVKKHSLSEYWAAGLCYIWQNPILQNYASNINVLDDIGMKIDGFPILWEEDDLNLDLIG